MEKHEKMAWMIRLYLGLCPIVITSVHFTAKTL